MGQAKQGRMVEQYKKWAEGGEGLAVPPFVSTGQVMEISRWSVGRGSRGRAVRQASLPVGLEC